MTVTSDELSKQPVNLPHGCDNHGTDIDAKEGNTKNTPATLPSKSCYHGITKRLNVISTHFFLLLNI